MAARVRAARRRAATRRTFITSPSEIIVVECPNCSERYTDCYRPSINLMIEDFDDSYLDEAASATCPACGQVAELDVLIVGSDGTWRISR